MLPREEGSRAKIRVEEPGYPRRKEEGRLMGWQEMEWKGKGREAGVSRGLDPLDAQRRKGRQSGRGEKEPWEGQRVNRDRRDCVEAEVFFN